MARILLLQTVLCLAAVHSAVYDDSCEDRSCYPEIGDLLIGRESRLHTNSTCGLDGVQDYCIVSHLEQIKKCFRCDSRRKYDPKFPQTYMSHRIENIVSTFRRDWKQRWWQAENGVENVYLQLDLEAEFRFTHLIMRFKTFRPRAMYIERSYDFGITWNVYRYYAHDCTREFPGIPTGPVRQISDVICESRYSEIAPSTEGEVVFRALPPSIEIQDPYSQDVQDLIKLTNLRIVFQRLHTLGDDKLGVRHDVNQKYYYSMYDLVVRGSCSCYGHASRCLPMDGQKPDEKRYMVFGVCECMHNTKGLNCEKCQDFYNDLPWRPALGTEINACRKCNCNLHSSRCHFDAAVYEATGRMSGGVCDDCDHNTHGKNCEECLPHFYQDPDLPLDHRQVCKPCNCDPDGSEHGGECESRTDPFNDLVAGRCICKRFVQGQRCDTCQNGYWNLQPDNSEGCERCTCNTVGTFGNEGCDKVTGQCRCKRYVTGRLCDECFPQYWGLSNDIDGCKSCDCDVGGALDQNCDQVTGQCRCRDNIGGRRCDRPLDGYFVPNLDYLMYEGEFAHGVGNVLPVIKEPTGVMTWTGPGYMKVSEGDSLEFTISNITLSMEYDIVIRYEPQMPERWDDIRVTVIRPGPVDQRGECANSIPQDDYKALTLPQGGVVYMPVDQLLGSSAHAAAAAKPQLLEEVGGESGEPEIGRQYGSYVGSSSQHNRYIDNQGNYVQETVLPGAFAWQGERYYVISPSSCLEQGVTYKIRFDFNRYRSNQNTPQASVLIDSIVLMPSTEDIPIFNQPGAPSNIMDEYTRYRCRENQLGAIHPEMPDVCKKHVFSIAAVMQQRAMECDCDLQGSRSGVCSPLGGQCECRNNIIGRRCDQCAPATYGFGNEYGCLACNCDPEGSRDNFCDVHNGQCLCVSDKVVGRTCERCSRGYYNFPRCRQCQCNGRSDTCDDRSGLCDRCRDNTAGAYCDRCAPGYHGDPRPGSNYGCRPCFCPGGSGSNYQHANTCYLDTLTNAVECDCPPGYNGPDCSTCAPGYYGNPNQPGGTCQMCPCNNNINTNDPGSCDPVTGQCYKCLFNTEGYNCETCESGYHGDATQQNCHECICNPLGRNHNAGPCDRETGQCPCLPNVIGLECGQCAPNHWKLASGYGCEFCGCDPQGSLDMQCNEFTGQCRCLPGRGGRDCSQCPDFYFGNPNTGQCKPCDCNLDGADSMQCDRVSGQCTCIEGVTGEKCDHCARGTTGTLPYCVPCGECFDNWDRIIQELKNLTDRELGIGGNIKITGPPSAFEKEFKDMEQKLEEVKKILNGTGVTQEDLDQITQKLEDLRKNLTSSDGELDSINDELDDTSRRIETANNKIDSIRSRVDEVKKAAEDLKNNVTSIRERDVTGAYNITRESLHRSEQAEFKVDSAMDTVADSERTRQSVDDLLNLGQAEFDRKYQDNEDSLADIKNEVSELNDKIVDLNEVVCDERGDPCDNLCGGAGCGKCGGLSCEDGAVTKADRALDYARRAETALKENAEKAGDLLDQVREAQEDGNLAKADAQMAYDEAARVKNISETSKAELEDLISRITEFLTREKARPPEIRQIAEEVLARSISLTPDQIQDLAQQINETIRGLTDIQKILDDTRGDLNIANGLKERADNAKKSADAILETAGRVVAALDKAEEEQTAAEEAILAAQEDITMAEGDLDMIDTETEAASSIAEDSISRLGDLQSRLDNLKVQYQQNKDGVRTAAREATEAQDLAEQASEDANELETRYGKVSVDLEQQYNTTKTVKERADNLRDRARALYDDYYIKYQKLQVMEDEFTNNEKTLTNLRDQIAALNNQIVTYLTDIQNMARFHRICE